MTRHPSLETNFQADSSSALKHTPKHVQKASFSLLQLLAWEFESQAGFSRSRVRLALLRLFARLSAPFGPRAPLPDAPSRILLIRPDHLGDVLFTTPAIRTLRTALPQSHLACLVGPWSRAVLEHNPHLDEIVTCHFPGFTRRPKPSLLQPYFALSSYARELRDKKFELAVVLRFDHWWGALLAYLARIPVRLGYDIAEVQPFLTEALPYVPGRHEVEQNLTLVERIAGGRQPKSSAPLSLEFPLTAEDEAFAERYLTEHGAGEDDFLVCIHPGTGAAVKLWREQAWIQVAEALVERYKARIVLTGSAGERTLAQAIATGMKAKTPPIVAAGETSLGQLAALMARCGLALGPDSGPLHLAVAVGTPTVHLYGPVDSRTFGPWGDPARHLIITSDMDCIPCDRLDYSPDELDEHPCIKRITVEQVLEAVTEALTRG